MEPVTMIAGIAALIATRVTDVVKVYIKRLIPKEEERRAVVEFAAMAIAAFSAWTVASVAKSYGVEVDLLIVIGGAILGSKGVNLLDRAVKRP